MNIFQSEVIVFMQKASCSVDVSCIGPSPGHSRCEKKTQVIGCEHFEAHVGEKKTFRHSYFWKRLGASFQYLFEKRLNANTLKRTKVRQKTDFNIIIFRREGLSIPLPSLVCCGLYS
jgi:hypothetical protein